MDPIEKYYATHKVDLDVLEPDPGTLGWLDAQLGHGAPRKRNLLLWMAGLAATLVIAAGGWWIAWSAEQAPAATAESPYALQVGDAFPELMLDDQFGSAVPLSSLQGKVVLVEFWASYSKVCTDRQCYYFKPIYEQYADHGFEIYGISIDTSMQDWLHSVESDGLPWVNVADFDKGKDHLEHKFLLEQIPTTYLLNAEGKVIAKDVGGDELEQHLERMLSEQGR